MRLTAPKTPAPGGGVEPAVRYDFLSSDEFRGMGGVLMPAATPPTVNNGLVLNGTTQYARARANFLMPQQFSLYLEFTPTFAYDANAIYTFLSGDAAAQGWLFKHNNPNLNRLFFSIGAGSVYVNGADYAANWRVAQRNKVCVRAISGAGVVYLNGVALATNNVAWVATSSVFYQIGADSGFTTQFPGTIYDVRIYTRLVTAAEAIEMTTVQ